MGLRRALNTTLSEDVRVLRVSEAGPDFHARLSATGKVYVYRLRRGELLHPHGGLVEALASEPLDIGAMREAAARLVGTRDFAPFSVTGSDAGSTVRTLARLDVAEEGSLARRHGRSVTVSSAGWSGVSSARCGTPGEGGPLPAKS